MKRVIACIDASPCVNATAEAAAWLAQKTQRQLVLLHVLDYRPTSYHLGEISGVIGFESNAMLLKELTELDEKQFNLAQEYSNNLLRHIAKLIYEKFALQPLTIQREGDFLEQCFDEITGDDIVVIGKLGESAAEQNKPVGSNVEGLIRGSKSTVLTVGETFTPPHRFLFAYEHSPVCQDMLERIIRSDLLKGMKCHLVYVGDQNNILEPVAERLAAAGFDLQVEYIYGEVAEALLQYQTQHDIQLMVMGAFSHSKLHQFFLGSTTLKIFKNSDVPMLVVY